MVVARVRVGVGRVAVRKTQNAKGGVATSRSNGALQDMAVCR